MNFRIGGKLYKISREGVIAVTRNSPTDIPDARYKYFVRLHGREYPIKQVVRLVTGLTPQGFTAHDAHRILTRLGFQILERSFPMRR